MTFDPRGGPVQHRGKDGQCCAAPYALSTMRPAPVQPWRCVATLLQGRCFLGESMRQSSVFVLRCVSPILFPIAMARGQLLVVSPDHPTHTLTVLSADASTVVRHCWAPDTPERQAAFLSLCADGALEWLDGPMRRVFARAARATRLRGIAS